MMTSNTYIYIPSLTISKPFNLIDNKLYYLLYTKLSMDPRTMLELIIIIIYGQYSNRPITPDTPYTPYACYAQYACLYYSPIWSSCIVMDQWFHATQTPILEMDHKVVPRFVYLCFYCWMTWCKCTNEMTPYHYKFVFITCVLLVPDKFVPDFGRNCH